MKLKNLLSAILIATSFTAFAQVGVGTTTPGAALDVVSTTAGVLVPRMDTATRTGLTVAADQNGMMVYDTTTATFWYYDHPNTTWVELANADTEPWFGDDEAIATTNTEDIYTMGNVAIGTTAFNDDANLELGATNKGFLTNRVALTTTNSPSPLSAHVAGMFVYNTATTGAAPNNVVPGMYFNTGAEWVLFQTPNSQATSLPPGVVEAFAGSTIPAGWLLCDGSAVSRATYATLFAEIGTAYGAGDGSTTFNLPDLRGEFIRGWDDGRGIDAGRVLGSSQLDQFKKHRHKYGYTNVGTIVGSGGHYKLTLSSGSYGDTYYTDQSTGGIGADETRPRNVAMNYIIKF